MLKLVRSNDDAFIAETTRAAFSTCATGKAEEIEAAMNILIRLKGIGPASASLVLSCYDPEAVPFFSDELFWFVNEAGPFDRSGKAKKVKISYSMKEYRDLLGKVGVLRKRVKNKSGQGVSAIDIEKAAYVDARDESKQDETMDKDRIEDVTEVANTESSKEHGVPRIRREMDATAPDTNVRASKRRKTAKT